MSYNHVLLTDYLNKSGRSGVEAYGFVMNLTPTDNVMIVKFKDGTIYAYMDCIIGKERFAKAKQLAEEGEGLATFISREHLIGARLTMEGSKGGRKI